MIKMNKKTELAIVLCLFPVLAVTLLIEFLTIRRMPGASSS